MPLGHLGINVTDLDEAKRYYDQVMPVLGYEPFVAHDDEFAYRPTSGKVGTYSVLLSGRRADGLLRRSRRAATPGLHGSHPGGGRGRCVRRTGRRVRGGPSTARLAPVPTALPRGILDRARRCGARSRVPPRPLNSATFHARNPRLTHRSKL